MRVTQFCSAAAPADVPGIRVLRRALDAHHPGARLTVAALPGARRLLDAIDGVDVVGLSDLSRGVHGSVSLLPTAEARALACPLVLERLLSDDAPCAVFLAADCDLRAPLTALEAALDQSDVVLLRRLDGRLPDDGERPDADDLLAMGELDDGVVAARGSAGSLRVVRWWLDHAVRGLRTVERGAVAGVLGVAWRALSGVEVLEDPGYGVSGWNLHERRLSFDDDGVPHASGNPVCLARFTDFRPDRTWWLFDGASRVQVLEDPVLMSLCRERAATLLEAGWTPPRRDAGVAIAQTVSLMRDERVRRLVANAGEAGEEVGDVENPCGEPALLAWLAEPAEAGAGAGLNRYTHDLWRARDDLRSAFPDLDGPDGDAFAVWLWIRGRSESALHERLLPPVPAEDIEIAVRAQDPRAPLARRASGGSGSAS
jgi:hypothetical protein